MSPKSKLIRAKIKNELVPRLSMRDLMENNRGEPFNPAVKTQELDTMQEKYAQVVKASNELEEITSKIIADIDLTQKVGHLLGTIPNSQLIVPEPAKETP